MTIERSDDSKVGVRRPLSGKASWESASACGRSRSGVTPWTTTVFTCVTCSLKDQCLNDALVQEARGRVVMGVAGGLTQSERRSVLRLAAAKVINITLTAPDSRILPDPAYHEAAGWAHAASAAVSPAA